MHLISDICKKEKASQGKTNAYISEKSGIPIATVNNFTSSGSKAPSVYTVGPICRVLGVSLDEYFGIVAEDMDNKEIARVTESYERNKKDLEETIANQNRQALHRDEIISSQEKLVVELQDRVKYQKRAIFWLRIGLAAAIIYGIVMDILNPALGLIR